MPREMQRSVSEAQSSNGSIWRKDEVRPGGLEVGSRKDGSRKQQKQAEQKRAAADGASSRRQSGASSSRGKQQPRWSKQQQRWSQWHGNLVSNSCEGQQRQRTQRTQQRQQQRAHSSSGKQQQREWIGKVLSTEEGATEGAAEKQNEC